MVATGALTEVGKISKALSKPKTRKTLLQKRLASLGRILVVLSVVLCSLVVGIGLIRTYDDTGKVVGKDVEEWVKVGISLAVSVIPEGLVAVTTITYTIGIQRMAQRHAGRNCCMVYLTVQSYVNFLLLKLLAASPQSALIKLELSLKEK